MSLRLASLCLIGSLTFAQDPQPELKQRPDIEKPGLISVAPGTHVLLNMINSVSTKQALVGDRIYLETAFPVISNGHIVVPQGSWVTGTITQVTRPKRLKGRAEMQIRFDSLTLPNGVSRDFRADLGSIDARDNQTLQREGSSIKGAGNKGGDAVGVATSAATGAILGASVGSIAGSTARGLATGALAGAAVGLVGVLVTRGPDASLTKGSTVEMVLDRTLSYDEHELEFRNAAPRSSSGVSNGPGPIQPAQQSKRWPF